MTSERSRIPCLSAAAAEGTGKKQQEGRAMATLDRKVPSPEAFLGKPWSSWIDAAKLHCSDNVDLEEAGKEGGKSREVMRLNKEDNLAPTRDCLMAGSRPTMHSRGKVQRRLSLFLLPPGAQRPSRPGTVVHSQGGASIAEGTYGHQRAKMSPPLFRARRRSSSGLFFRTHINQLLLQNEAPQNLMAS
uniref:Ataxin 7 like 1 n=1 Tax=Felis catus TaxID=9685 RepID=A0ABI7XG53_FELCA